MVFLHFFCLRGVHARTTHNMRKFTLATSNGYRDEPTSVTEYRYTDGRCRLRKIGSVWHPLNKEPYNFFLFRSKSWSYLFYYSSLPHHSQVCVRHWAVPWWALCRKLHGLPRGIDSGTCNKRLWSKTNSRNVELFPRASNT